MVTEREHQDAKTHRAPLTGREEGKPPHAREQMPAPTPWNPPADQISTPPSDFPLVGGKQVQAVIGPYAGQRLTMPTAEADQAIADHWAIVPREPPLDPDADPLGGHTTLTDAERQAAQDAAQTWADAQLPHTEPADKPAIETRPTRQDTRDMHAGDHERYETRGEPTRRK